ncbi:MAG: DUF1080 domain-containing protein, partial [Chloroflexi bacterium]|nr:DUF1080 domain-containing protein [Chloroflexota bacterium]
FVPPPAETAQGAFTPPPAAPVTNTSQPAVSAFVPPPSGAQDASTLPPTAPAQGAFVPPPAAATQGAFIPPSASVAPSAASPEPVVPPPPAFMPPPPAGQASIFGQQATPQAAKPSAAAPLTSPQVQGSGSQQRFAPPAPPQPPAGGTEQPKKKSKTGRIVLGCVIALIVVVVIVIVAASLLAKNTDEDTTSSSATKLFRTAESAAVGATKAVKTPTAVKEEPVVAEDIIYEDDFSDSSSGWSEWQEDDSVGGYEDGQYTIEVLAPDAFFWAYTGQDLADFVLDVDASKLAGIDDNHYGVILRYQDEQNFYMFSISSDGYYRFGYYKDDEWTDIIDWEETSAIKQGDATNHITVQCKGSKFTLKVNGKELVVVTDKTFGSGDIGLFAGASDEAGVKIAFDNLVIQNN